MPDILIRGLDEETLKRLKARAKRHGRSLQREAKHLLEEAAGADPKQVSAIFANWREEFAGRRFSDSTELIAEDRQR